MKTKLGDHAKISKLNKAYSLHLFLTQQTFPSHFLKLSLFKSYIIYFVQRLKCILQATARSNNKNRNRQFSTKI